MSSLSKPIKDIFHLQKKSKKNITHKFYIYMEYAKYCNFWPEAQIALRYIMRHLCLWLVITLWNIHVLLNMSHLAIDKAFHGGNFGYQYIVFNLKFECIWIIFMYNNNCYDVSPYRKFHSKCYERQYCPMSLSSSTISFLVFI